MVEESLGAAFFWIGLNVFLMFVLAFNVTRHRAMSQKEQDYDSQRLELAIRTHGNNAEYVPVILFMVYLLAVQGSSAVMIHVIGAVLLIARLFHAYGMQQLGAAVHRARVVGVLGTWGVMLVCLSMLIYKGAAVII